MRIARSIPVLIQAAPYEDYFLQRELPAVGEAVSRIRPVDEPSFIRGGMNSSRDSRVASRDFPVRFSQLPSSADGAHRSAMLHLTTNHSGVPTRFSMKKPIFPVLTTSRSRTSLANNCAVGAVGIGCM